MSGNRFVAPSTWAGSITWLLSHAGIYFFSFKSGNMRRASCSHWLMGVLSWIRDCCMQELDYLGQTRGVSTEPSGNRPREATNGTEPSL